MKAYVKPDMEITTFVPNEAIATSSCEKINPNESTTVTCLIGGQTETVFTSGSCNTKASKYAFVEDYDADGTDYFVWYTGRADSDGNPSGTLVELLNAVVTKSGNTAGPGWHFAKIDIGKSGSAPFTVS